MTVNGLSGALSGIQRQTNALDRAAERVTRATTAEQAPREQAGVEESGASELASGMVETLVARRMLSAALKMAQTANEGIMEALRVGGYNPA